MSNSPPDRVENGGMFARWPLRRRPGVLVASVLFAGLLMLFIGTRPPLTSAAASSDRGSGIVAALPANAAATNQYVSINSVSCPSVGNCSAVGSYTDDQGGSDGLLLTETGGKWAVGVEAVLPANAGSESQVVLSSVSCASEGNCAAVGTYANNSQGLLLTETDGTWGAGVAAALPTALSSSPWVDLASVSCASPGNCSAVGTYDDSSAGVYEGLLLSETGGRWATGVEVSLPASAAAGDGAFLDSVSCASAGNCTAVGHYYSTSDWALQGLLVSETAGSWTAGVEAQLPANAAVQVNQFGIDSVSCASPGNCTAVGTYGDSSAKTEGLLLTQTAGGWATGVEASLPANAATGGYPAPVLALNSVSCVSAGNCTAVGSYYDSSGNGQGLLLTETGGTWAAGVEAALPTDAATIPQGVNLDSVSCASAGNCDAAGSYGVSTGGGAPLVLTETAGSWATGVEPSVPANASPASFVSISSVSCASAGNCTSAGSYGASSGSYYGLLVGGSAPLVLLTVSTIGPTPAGTVSAGAGTVSSSPAGISCGTACSHAFLTGTPVTLTATPAAGSIFTGWSGCLAVDSTTCATTIDSDTPITATFDRAPKPKPKPEPEPCLVPNLKGKTLAAATRSTKANACAVGTVGRVVSSEIQGVLVISQSPKPGTRLEHGATVDLVLASATPFHCRVPKLFGLSVRAAEKRIRLADCRVGGIRRRTSTLLRESHVLEQNPARGRTKAAGASVALVVGKGPRTGRLPSLGSTVPSQLPPFIAYDPPAAGIWLMKPDGSDAHQVGPADATGPAWSPDATQILYTAAAPQNGTYISDDLYVMNAHGSNRHPLMPSAGGEGHGGWGDYDFHWSPDSKQVVFSDSQYMSADVGIANADGSDEHLVPNTGGGGEASFSPDGSYIVFVGNGGRAITLPDIAKSGLYVIKPDGTGLRELTFGGGVEDPSWSPDGTRIIYGCLGGHGICQLSGNPARQRILYRNTNQTLLDPSWNANGTKILVTLAPSQGSEKIALLSPSGGPPVVIATLSPLYSDTSWNADW